VLNLTTVAKCYRGSGLPYDYCSTTKGRAKSHMSRNENPYPIWIKFCRIVDISDIIIYAIFGYDRLGFFSGAERRQISPFPVGFYRLPYDTLALPREYVISLYFSYCILCLQCFDAVGWAAGRASGL